MAAETEFCWMEKTPTGRHIVPRSDRREYEFSVDLLFDSREQAQAWRVEELDMYEGDPGEIEYINSWVLCRRTIEEVED